MKKRLVQIGVVGCYASQNDRVGSICKTAQQVGQEIAARNAVLMFDTEDYHGCLFSPVERAVTGALEKGGMVLGFSDSMTAQYPTIVINTGPNKTALEYMLALSCDAILVVGGDTRETLRIMTIARQAGMPVIPIEGTGGWSDQPEFLREALRDTSTWDPLMYIPHTPKEAVKAALDMMKYKTGKE